MQRFTFIRILSFALVLSMVGCAQLPTGQQRLELVDQLVAEQEFSRASKLLEDVPSADPAYEQLQIRKRAMGPLIEQFENTVLRSAELLQANDEWPQALQLIDDALDKLPASAALHNGREQFFAARAEKLDEIGKQLDLLEAQYLAQKAPHLQKKLDVNPASWVSRWQNYRHNAHSEDLAIELLECGQIALEQDDFDLAESCLTMAKGLSTTISVEEPLAKLSQRRAQVAQQARQQAVAKERARKAKLAQQVSELKARYLQLLAAGWWVPARETLVEIKQIAPEDIDATAWEQQLSDTLSVKINQGIRQGQSLYSRGYLKEALAIWRDTAELDPDNPELKGHIARVERFIDKLNRLNRGEG